MSEAIDSLKKLFETKDERNYDPRMEELMRSDRLIDPKNECLSKLENPEIYHIAKIRGAQLGFSVTGKQLREIYNRPNMINYHCDYIDFIRNLNDVDAEKIKLGGLPMMAMSIEQLITLRKAEDAWVAKLYADSIKPQVANNPIYQPMMPQEEKEGWFSKVWGFLFGKKSGSDQQQQRRY